MPITDIPYQAILDRIVEIFQADTTNLYSSTKLKKIITGVYPKGALEYDCATVTFKTGNDTFYDTGSLGSNHELYILVTIYAKGNTGAEVETALLNYTRYMKQAIKNNTKLYRPATTLDPKVDRAWPIKFEKAYGYRENFIIGGEWLTIRATVSL